MSGLALRPQMLDSGNAGDSSVAGILGADTLAHEKWVVLDYAGGLVVLGMNAERDSLVVCVHFKYTGK